ncbi:MAG: hypothetical protein AAGF71_12295 [Pseudomonadota bacterium]
MTHTPLIDPQAQKTGAAAMSLTSRRRRSSMLGFAVMAFATALLMIAIA